MKKKNIYITGASGQDATLLTNYFNNKKNVNLILISNKKKIKINSKKINYKFINTDLTDLKKIKKIFKLYIPDKIIHLASSNPSFKDKNAVYYYKKNFVASKNLLNLAFEFNSKSKLISQFSKS